MSDQDKTKQQLIEELGELRRRVAASETSETEWRRTEEALQGSEERFRLLVEAIPQPIWRSDADGNVIEFNRRWYEYTGQTAEDVKGNGWTKALHPDEAAMVVDKVRAGITTGTPIEIVNRLRRASDGSYRWHLARAVPMNARDGKTIGWFGCATDIDDQKRAEEALRQSQQRLSSHFQQTPLAAIEWDVEGRVTKWNPSAEQIFGYSQAEALGHHYPFLVPPHRRKHVAQVEADLRAGTGGQRNTDENLTKDGRTIFCEWYNTVLTDAEGHLIGAMSLAQDITDAKQANEALQRSEQTLRTLIDASPESILLADTDGTILFANKTVADRLGRTIDQVIGHKHHEILPPEVAANRMRHFEEVVHTGKPLRFEDERFDRHIESAMHPVIDETGKVTTVAVLGIDRTERKRVEEALRVSEERIRQAVRAANLGVFEHDHRTDVIQWSAEMRQIYGIGPEEPVSISMILDFYHPDDRESIAAAIQRAHDPRGDGVYSADNEIFRRDGTVRWLILRSKTFFDNEGGMRRPVRTVGVAMDITERKRAEEALKQANDELERRVEERTINLLKANRELNVLRMFAETASQGFLIVDLDGYVKYLNPMMCRLLGEVSCDDVVGQHFFTRARSLGFVRETFLPTLLREGRWEQEGLLRTQQGTVVPIWNSSFLVRDNEGQPTYIASILSDITERKRAEAALRQSHDELQAIYDQILDGIVIADLDELKVVRTNAAFCRMLGYSEEEMKTVSPEQLYPGELGREVVESGPTVQEYLEAVKAGQVVQRDSVHLLRKDGSMLYADVVCRGINYHERSCVVNFFHDVTERNRAEQALKASEDRYRTVVEDQTEVICRFKGDGTLTFVNEVFCRLFGKTQGQLLGNRWQPEAVAEDVPLIERQLRSLSPDRPVVTIDNRVHTGSGEIRWMQFVNRGSFDQQGRLTEIQAVGRDITERKRAEEELGRTRHLLSEAEKIAHLGSFEYVAETQTTVWSEEEYRIFGLDPADPLPARNVLFEKCFHPDDRGLFQEVYKKASQSLSAYELEHRILRPNGEVRWVHSRAEPHFDDSRRLIRYSGATLDITERKQMEEALRQSRDELQTIYGQIMDGIVVVDAETARAIHMNSAFCRMLGYSEEDMRKVSPEQLHPKNAYSKVLEHLETVKRGMIAKTESAPFLHKDGSTLYFDVISSPIRYSNRSCWIGFFHDVTERKRAEQALRKEHHNLKHLLQASDHERQIIAYEIHDELAQQLAGAIMQFQTYAYQKGKLPIEATKAFDAGMTMLQQGHSEARRLISGVRPPILDEEGVVPAITHLVNDERRRKGPEIEFRSKVNFDRLVPILENAIYRIVQEGLTNACQHSQSKQVRINLLQRKDRVRIEIRDWGIGFDTKTAHENRFGLTGIRQRARLLGGKCSIRSIQGKGTRIRVELPVVERE